MSYYWYKGFLVDEGLDSLHEHIHYWHHIATTFGSVQMINFHIAAKAMRIAFQNLIEKNILTFPITQRQLELLSEEDDLRVLSRALSITSLVDEIRESSDALIEIMNSNSGLYADRSHAKPIVRITKNRGYELNSRDISEFHALTVESLGDINNQWKDVKLKHILDLVLNFMPIDTRTLIILAYLCSWAFMPPYDGVAKQQWPGEYFPAWRFLIGLEQILNDPEQFNKLYKDYNGFTNSLSCKLNWIEQQSIVSSHYDSLIKFVHRQTSIKKDSKVNRLTYQMIGEVMVRAQAVHREKPEAIALPHLHEAYLLKKIPVLIKMKEGKLVCRTKIVSKWYYPYLENLSMVLQAFNDNEIKCVYRHMEIESQCRFIREIQCDTTKCYVAPHSTTDQYLKCGFFKMWNYFFTGQL